MMIVKTMIVPFINALFRLKTCLVRVFRQYCEKQVLTIFAFFLFATIVAMATGM